jgi:hypothetical protein
MLPDKYVKDIRGNYTSTGQLLGFEMLVVTSVPTKKEGWQGFDVDEKWIPIPCYIIDPKNYLTKE